MQCVTLVSYTHASLAAYGVSCEQHLVALKLTMASQCLPHRIIQIVPPEGKR